MAFAKNELMRLRELSRAAHTRCLATGLSGSFVNWETLEKATLDQLDDAEAADAACKVADQAVEEYQTRRR